MALKLRAIKLDSLRKPFSQIISPLPCVLPRYDPFVENFPKRMVGSLRRRNPRLSKRKPKERRGERREGSL